MVHLPYSFNVRLAIVKEVGRTYVDFQFLDRLDDQTFRAPIPHPYAGRGGGVFVGVEPDTLVLVAAGPMEKWYIAATIPDHNFFFDLGGAGDIRFDESSYPELAAGEIQVKGNKGQIVELSDNGNIVLDASLGTKSADIELSRDTSTLYNRSPQSYQFSEFGRAVEGVIKRDINPEETGDITNTVNFLDSESYERLLSEIGRHPRQEVHNRTTKLMQKQVVRNPALVEKRSILYEYADSFNVMDFESEVAAADAVEKNESSEIARLQRSLSDRQNRRTDVLNLNLNNFNHLIEKVEGTVVDIYGNILDINRNIINIPDAQELSADGNATNKLREIYDHHRRSIKLHYEINSRKPISSSEPLDSDLNKQNAASFSRWSVDVDGEGLTKINIPKSSETGNIPILSRYFTSRDSEDLNNGAFKDSDRRDVRIKPFGPRGISIDNSDYRPVGIDSDQIATGTAWHDMTQVATGITGESPISTSLNNKIGGTDNNAGGRSLNMNLDGSWELSIGADDADKKSMLLDTKGGIVAHIGSDNNARSVTASMDGEMLIEIGGTPISDFEGPGFPQSGRLVIHVNSSFGPPQKIIIDDRGMTVDIQGGMYFKSTQDMTFEAGGKMLLQATDLGFYGAGDINERKVGGVERKVLHTGIPNHM